jgi:hypothetical protein
MSDLAGGGPHGRRAQARGMTDLAADSMTTALEPAV